MKELVLTRLVASFAEECQTELEAINREKNSITNNGRHMNAWDIRFKHIVSASEEMKLDYKIIETSSLWSYVVVTDEDKMYLFTKESNLQKVLKDKQKDPLHYILCTTAINTHLNGTAKTEQIELLEDYLAKVKKDKRERYYGELIAQVKEVVVFTLEQFENEAVKVKEVLIDSTGNIVKSIDHSNNIMENYSDVLTQEKGKSNLLEGISLKENLKEEGRVPKLKQEEKENE